MRAAPLRVLAPLQDLLLASTAVGMVNPATASRDTLHSRATTSPERPTVRRPTVSPRTTRADQRLTEDLSSHRMDSSMDMARLPLNLVLLGTDIRWEANIRPRSSTDQGLRGISSVNRTLPNFGLR